MPTEHGTIQGDLSVTAQFTLRGVVSGTAYVRDGGELQMHGLVGGDVVVERGGVANLHGIVQGNVRNQGGTIHIYGMIHGRVFKDAGRTVIAPTADIKNETRP